MQGHGRTRDISRDIRYEGMADDVSGPLKHLKIDSADILAYSMGAGIAFVRDPKVINIPKYDEPEILTNRNDRHAN